MLLMRILNPSLALVLGLALAPAAALAQASNSSVPPPNPSASVTSSTPVTTQGQGTNSVPVGGPGVDKHPHAKTHKRAHHKLYGKHYDYVRGGTKKGPTAPHLKTTGTE